MSKYFWGILLSLILSLLSIAIASIPTLKTIGLSAVIIAILLGIVIGNTLYPKVISHCKAGVEFTKGKILRLAIILFGLKITFNDISLVGYQGIIIDVLMVTFTFFITLFIGLRYFKMDKENVILIGSGCSICGAAAVVATEPTIKAKSESVTIAVAVVVIFGTLAMFIYPMIYSFWAKPIGISDSQFGIYIGSTIHEVAQVVAAGDAINSNVTNIAVISKMIRVILLAPFLLILSIYLSRKNDNTKKQIVIPWFALGFLIMAGVRSLNIIPENILNILIEIDTVLLVMAMTALGLTSHYSIFKKAGFKPILLGAIIFVWLIFGGAAINYLITISL